MRDALLRFALLFAVMLPASGCDEKPLAVALNSDVAKGWSYAALASATFDQSPAPAPAPAPQPSPGGKCSTCNGTGRVGDGRVFQPCMDCEGDGIAEVLQARSPACKCDDCKCEPCECGEVLSLPGATALAPGATALGDCVGGVCRIPAAIKEKASGDCPGGVCASPGAPQATRAPARIVPRFRLFRR